MKKTIFLLLILMISCSRTESVYHGVIQDVEYGGFIFDSCEIHLLLNNESSTRCQCSSKSKEFCDNVKNNIGNKVIVNYKQIPWYEAFKIDTFYICEDFKVVK